MSRSLLAALVAATLFLSACAGGDLDALAVGDRSISREGLNDLVLGANGLVPDAEDTPVQLDAAAYRNIASLWLIDAANAEYLESIGVTITDDEREEIKLVIEDAISAGQFGAISRSSEAYEALTTNVWLGGQTDLTSPGPARMEVAELLRGASVDSRLGVWVPDPGSVVPRAAFDQ